MKIVINYLALLPLIFAIVIFSSDIKANEAIWKQYATGKDRTRHYYDTQSVMYVSDTIVRVWEKTSTSEASASLTKELHTFREVDCSKLRYRVLEMRVTYRDGTEKNQSFTNPKWVDITHNTWMHTLYEILCKRKQQ